MPRRRSSLNFICFEVLKQIFNVYLKKMELYPKQALFNVNPRFNAVFFKLFDKFSDVVIFLDQE